MNMWKVTVVLEQTIGGDVVYCFVVMADTKGGAIEMSFAEFEYMPDYKTQRVVVEEIKNGILQIAAQ